MYNNRPETDEIEIDLLKLAQVLLRKAVFIIAITLLVAAAAFGITFFLITPQYTSTAMMYVNNSNISIGGSFSISSSELTAAQSLVDTYVVILKSRTTLEDIIQRENLDYTYEEFYDMIESGPVNSTEIFDINVTSHDPYEAERVANTIAQVLPDRIASIVDGSDVRIVDYAVVPSERTSPSYTLNTVIGALIGFVLAAVIVILRYLFDDQIHEETYLTQTYPDIPLLAVVPDMLSSDAKGYYYYSSGGDSGGGKQKRSSESRKEQPARRNTAQQPASKPQRPAPPAQRPAPPAQRPASSAQRPAPAAQRPAPSAQRPAAPAQRAAAHPEQGQTPQKKN